MMQPADQNFPPSSSWPNFNSFINSTIDQFEPYGLNMGVHFEGCDEFSSSFTTRENSSEISSIMFSNEIFPYISAISDQLVPLEDFPVPFEGFESILTEDLYNCLNESDQESLPSSNSQPFSYPRQDVWSPSSSMDATTSTQSSVLTIPGEAMEIDNQLSIIHLLKAYGEAREKNQTELGDVILRCVSEKSSPVGETWEKIAFNLSQDQGDYLMQESSKNFQAAFRAFYQMFPYGRFAHFAANSAILEAMPSDADMLHIVDFDIREGIQWPPMIEAMAWQRKTLRLTSIRWGNEDLGQSPWTFEDTRRQLCDHAKSFGLNLKMEEMGIEDLVNELQKMRKRGGNINGEYWLAFNCMTGLPHMGKSKSRNLVNEFLNVAKEVLSSSGTRNRGIITFSDGDACGNNLKDCSSGFGSFFDGQLMHYQAILESMQSNFPNHLMQARMAMEALFVGPNICCQDWFRKWKEMSEVSCHFQAGIALEGLRVSTERLMEAKEIVRESESSYQVRINGGNCGNELTLGWRGTTLVRVSSWRN